MSTGRAQWLMILGRTALSAVLVYVVGFIALISSCFAAFAVFHFFSVLVCNRDDGICCGLVGKLLLAIFSILSRDNYYNLFYAKNSLYKAKNDLVNG